MTLFGVARHVSLLAVSCLSRFVALWRTLGCPEDSLSSNARLEFISVASAPSPSPCATQSAACTTLLRSLASPDCVPWLPLLTVFQDSRRFAADTVPRRSGSRRWPPLARRKGASFASDETVHVFVNFTLLPRPFEVRRSHCERSSRPLDAGNR